MADYKQPKNVGGKQPDSDVPSANNKQYLKALNVSVGNVRSNDYPGTKTDGIKIRGTGAATKGTMARGPMA